MINTIIKKSINRLGFDISRTKNCPEQTLLGLVSSPPEVVLDIGANTGQFAKYISNLIPEAVIYCFEPLPEPYKQLEVWAKTQPHSRILTYNIAIGDSEGTTEIFFHTDHSSSSSFLKSTDENTELYPVTKSQRVIPVKLTTLDKVISELEEPLPKDTLVKIDVQGFEDRVLRGGKETLRRASACLLEVCLNNLYEKQASFLDIVSILYDLGYEYAGNYQQTYADDGHVIFLDALFRKYKK